MTGQRTRAPRSATGATCEVEAALLGQGASVVAGMDEVGRGAWAGPVVVGALALDRPTAGPSGLDDSKRLTPGRRRALCEPIRSWSAGWGLGWASAEEVDRVGLTAALGRAGARALAALGLPAEVVILDGGHDWLTPSLEDRRSSARGTLPRVVTVVGADRRCATVAAASVLAKVARDDWMTELGSRWPDFGFEAHKGYGTALHRRALERLGPTPEHRRSWSIPAAAARSTGVREVPASGFP